MAQKAHVRRWGIICAIFASFFLASVSAVTSNDTVYAYDTSCTMTVDQMKAGYTCDDLNNMQYTKDAPLCSTVNGVTTCQYYDLDSHSWIKIDDGSSSSTTEPAAEPSTEPTTEPPTEPAGLDPSTVDNETTTKPSSSDECLIKYGPTSETRDTAALVRCMKQAAGMEVDEGGDSASNTNVSDAMSAGGEFEDFATPQSSCYGDNPEMSWFACPLADDLSNFITFLYEHMIEKWLIYPPQALQQTTSAGKVTNKVWSDIRNLANALFVVYLLVIIFSQITGWQIQQYGIKKALPRAIIMIVLVNLSYIICQGVVDISNILGSGVGAFFNRLNGLVVLSVEGSSTINGTGGLVILVVVLIGIIVAALFMGPAFLLPILFTLIGAVMTIFMTFAMLAVRQALMTGLVIISPLAIACAALPGTEKLYKKWFGLFKGLVFTYPIAAFLVYGGSFAGRLVVKTMGESGFISGLIGVAVVVVPPCFLPKITTSSIAAIDGAILKFKQNLTGGAQNALGRSRLADKMRRQTEKRKVERASGGHIDKNGNVRIRKHFRTKHMNDHLGDLQRMGAQIKENKNYSNNRYRNNIVDEQLIKEADDRLNTQGSFTVDQLADMLGTGDDPAMDAAITRRLRNQGDNGRDALYRRIGQLENTGGAKSETALTNIAGELNRGREQLKNEDGIMADWARDVTNNGVSSAGRLSTRQLTNSQVNKTTGASFKTMDTRAVNNYLNQIRQNSGTQSAAHVQQAVQDLLKSSSANDLTVEKRRLLEQFATENLSAPVAGSWLA